MNALDDLSIPDPIDGRLPRWVIEENYPDKQKDMLEALYQASWWHELVQLADKKGRTKPQDTSPEQWLAHLRADYGSDWSMLEYQIGSAAARSAVALADVLKADFDAVFHRALWSLTRRRLWEGGREEYESLEEFLIDRIPRLKENSGERYDILFLMEHLLPALREMGGEAEPERLLALPRHWSKARRAVPYLRPKIKQVKEHLEDIQNHTELGERISKDFAQAIENIVRVIADPNVPQEGPTGVTQTLFSMDQGMPQIEPAQGHMGLLSGEKCLVFFVIPASWQRAIERALGNLVSFETIDPQLGLQELDHLLHPKGRHNTY